MAVTKYNSPNPGTECEVAINIPVSVTDPPSTHSVGVIFKLPNRLALKSGIDSHLESPQVGHSRPANTAQRLNLVYVVASSD